MSFLSSLAQKAQAVAAQVNPLDNGRTYNTVMQRGANYAPQAPASIYQQVQRTPLIRADRAIVNTGVNIGRGLYTGALGVGKAAIIAPVVSELASFSKNPFVRQQAANYQTQADLQARGLIAPILRTLPEVAATVTHPLSQFTYHPNSPLEKALFGDTPVQNIQKKVANNYDQHPNLNPLERVGLAGAEAVGSVAQDAPVIGAAGKIAKVGAATSKDAAAAVKAYDAAQNQGGFVRVGYPQPKELPKPVQNQIADGYNFSNNSNPAERLAANKLTPRDVQQAIPDGPAMKATDIKTIANAIPEFKANPVMSFNPAGKIPGRVDPTPTFEYKSPNHQFSLAADRMIPQAQLDQLKNLKAGEQVDFSQALLNGKKGPLPAITETAPGDRLPGTGQAPVTALTHQATELKQAVEQHLAKAQGDQSGFVINLAKVAKDLGEKHQIGPLKTAERAIHKTIHENRGDLARLRDAVRGTVHLSNPAEIEKHLAAIGKHFEITRVKNTLDLPRGKYRQVIANVKLPSGIEGEIQMTTPEMQFAKKQAGGHQLYKMMRIDKVNEARAGALMDKIYGSAHDAETNRLNSSSVISLPSAKALTGGKEVPPAVSATTVPSLSRKTLTGTSATSKNLGKLENKSDTSSIIPPKTPKGKLPVKTTGPAPGEKLSRFANKTIPASPEVSAPLKEMVKEERAGYTPVTNKAQIAAADQWLKGKSNEDAFNEVVKAFEDKPTAQDAIKAIALFKRLDASGKESDQFLATELAALQSPKGSEAGQFIQAFSTLNHRTPEGLRNAAAKTLKKAGVDLTDDIKKNINDHIAAIKKTAEGSDERQIAAQELVDYTNQLIPRTKMEAGIDFWRAGLLTGPETVAKIATSHLMTSPIELLVRPAAAVTDKLVSSAPKGILQFLNRNDAAAKANAGRRTVTFAPSDLGAFGKGYKRGAGAAKAHLTTGIDVPHTGGFAKDFGKAHHQTAYERTVYRVHGSVYKPFYSGAYKMEEANMRRIAKKQFGNDQAKINEFMKKPSTQKQMEEYAAQFAMQNETEAGRFTQTIQHFAPGGVPVGQWIAPFSRIPAALGIKGIVDYTPIGTVRSARQLYRGIVKGEFDQRKFVETLSKSAAGGTAITATGYMLMNSGRMTLQAPTDPKEKALWAAEGKPKNSIKIGNKWVSLNAMGPVGLALGLGGAYARAHQSGQSGSKATAQALASATKLLADQPYMKGLGGVTDALNNPVQKGSSYVQTAITSWVPAGVQQIARGTDTVARQYPEDIKQALQQTIPILREKSNPAVNPDMFGNNQPGTGRAGVVGGILGTTNPFYPSDQRGNNDGPTQELQRLYSTLGSQDSPSFANPTTVTLFGNKISLNNKQLAAMLQGTGPMIHDGIQNLLTNPDYQTLSDLDKSKQISDVIHQARQDWIAQNADSVFNASQLPDKTGKGKSLASSGTAPGDYGTQLKTAGVKLNPKLDAASRQALISYAQAGSAKYLSSSNDAQYKYDQAKYNNDVANGSLSPAQKAKAEYSLGKSQVGSNFSKNIRDIYSLNKTVAWNVISKDPNGQDLANQLLAYGDALHAAGYGSNKFRTSSGSVSLRPKKAGGRSGGTSAKKQLAFNSAQISAIGALNKKVASAKVKKATFSSKSFAPKGLIAFKKAPTVKNLNPKRVRSLA